MKVTYEFDPYEDKNDLHLTEIRNDMFKALGNLRNLRKSIYKGWDNWEGLTSEQITDKLIDKLDEILICSKIDEID